MSCSVVQRHGKEELRSNLASVTDVICKDRSDSLLIIRTGSDGWTKPANYFVSDHPSLKVVDDNPIGNNEVRVEVVGTEDLL